ncbi:MAG: hypothetical protein CVU61_03855 [Deltaproteobacteria bacterium HGW-Deltaproteobacteria-19]|nr:MAG: hypothetical protein CVU61_03855 [Deltaproteobacteria bacterium HGW-Deltaproteobacteria-19]
MDELRAVPVREYSLLELPVHKPACRQPTGPAGRPGTFGTSWGILQRTLNLTDGETVFRFSFTIHRHYARNIPAEQGLGGSQYEVSGFPGRNI